MPRNGPYRLGQFWVIYRCEQFKILSFKHTPGENRFDVIEPDIFSGFRNVAAVAVGESEIMIAMQQIGDDERLVPGI